jgi:hypothetical protein
MTPMTDWEKTRRSANRAERRRESSPDRRRAPAGPPPDPRATERAIERLWAVVGR